MNFTRREILHAALSVPLVASPDSSGRISIIAEDHCLAQESAAGFAKLQGVRGAGLILPAVRSLTPKQTQALNDQFHTRSTIIFECSPDISRHLPLQFEITLDQFLLCDKPWNGEYIESLHPIQRLLRPSYGLWTISPSKAQVVARLNGSPVAITKPWGRGILVFLGAMLGPCLFAEEREAKELTSALFDGF